MPKGEVGATVVVTGGAGFIGSHLVDALLAYGHRVVVIDDLSTGRPENLSPGAHLHRLDVRSDEAAALVRDCGATALFHLAAQIDVRRSVANPKLDADINVMGLLNLLEGGRAGGLKKVVFSSSGGTVYGEQEVYPATETHPTRPLSPYGVAKLASEHYLYCYHRDHGIDATVLRYANVYGPRQSPHGEAGVVAIFTTKLLRGDKPVINGDGEQTRDYVHVHDVVAANRAALGRPGFSIYNVGTGTETTVNALFATLREHLGGPVAGFGPAKLGEQRRSSISSARLAAELGVQVSLDLPGGLRATADWFRTQHS